MSLEPLLAEGPIIYLHAFFALAAMALGAVQLAAPKGTPPHRTLGWVWAALMAGVAGGSFLIHGIRMWGPFSWIHILSIVTLVGLTGAVLAARKRDVKRHARGMILLYVLALLVTGGFTLAPGRVMHTVVFGG